MASIGATNLFYDLIRDLRDEFHTIETDFDHWEERVTDAADAARKAIDEDEEQHEGEGGDMRKARARARKFVNVVMRMVQDMHEIVYGDLPGLD